MQTLNRSATFLALPPPSRAAGVTLLRELPAPGELPPYTATQLGPRRAELARALRERLRAAGLTWPDWIDRRPGRLRIILGDLSDPPLGRSAAALAAQHGALLLDGLAALGLITGVAQLGLCTSDPAALRTLRELCRDTTVEVHALPAVYPMTPESFVADAGERAYAVPAAQLARIGALVQGVKAPRLCTIAGAVTRPQVVELTDNRAGGLAAGEPAATPQDRAGPGAGESASLPATSRASGLAAGEPSVAPQDRAGPGAGESASLPAANRAKDPPDSGLTPAALVRLCGGASTAAWVAVVGGALGGVLWPADRPLPAATALCLILPTGHELVARLRRGTQWHARARNACLSCQACTDFCPVAQSGVPLSPHRLMRLAAFAPSAGPGDNPDPSASAADSHAASCTGCGACSVMCPAELLPGALIQTLALIPSGQSPSPDSRKLSTPSPAPPSVPPPVQQRVPLRLLLTRLGLTDYA